MNLSIKYDDTYQHVYSQQQQQLLQPRQPQQPQQEQLQQCTAAIDLTSQSCPCHADLQHKHNHKHTHAHAHADVSLMYIISVFVTGMVIGSAIMSSSRVSCFVNKVKEWIYDKTTTWIESNISSSPRQEQHEKEEKKQKKQIQQQKMKKSKSESRMDDILSFKGNESNRLSSKSLTTSTPSVISAQDGIKNEPSNTKIQIDNDNDNDNDEGYEVLHGSMMLLMKHFFEKSSYHDMNNMNDSTLFTKKDLSTTKVIDYLSPKEMACKLFDKSKPLSMNLNNCGNSSNGNGTSTSSQQMIQLFEQMTQFSVNTSHPFFFNQLFGTLDPIALAAEIIALAAHTSPYTWETAPVFTMIEREVMIKLGQLVFERDDNDDDNENENDNMISNHKDDVEILEKHDAYNDIISNKYDGLMMPGGSLSNLTAIHVARHVSQTGEIQKKDCSVPEIVEEKKEECYNDASSLSPSQPQLVAFVSSEAHYSFMKAASVTGIGVENLISVPTLHNGQMDVDKLDSLLTEFHNNNHTGCEANRQPFFVAATAGSTVRGSFDDVDAIVKICRKHENIINLRNSNSNSDNRRLCKIWVHVDGAWGGSAIFSKRKDMRHILKGIQHADSFTFNPHKMLGAPQQTTAFISRHKGILKAANSSQAKYLFDSRKNGAECDLGDGSYTCGRRTDAIKLWAQWKYYGPQGIGQLLEKKVDSLSSFAEMIKTHDSFMLACTPWPFNVNFFYLPERMRRMLKQSGVDITSENPVLPDEISKELSIVSVELKLKLHQSGEMLIPYQPLSNQKADCFRLVLAGKKVLDKSDYLKVMQLMESYGSHL